MGGQRFADKVAVVTGGGGGLGGEYCRAFAREGAQVVAVDLNHSGLQRLTKSITEDGGRCDAQHADLCRESDVQALFKHCAETHGGVDILVNNAGGDLAYAGPIEGLPVDHWDTVVDRNLKTAFLCARAAVPIMKRKRCGKIVNISSRAARSVGWYGAVTVAYICAKLGVIGLTRHLAKELGPHGINVNCLVPAFTISGPLLQQQWDSMTEGERETMLRATPLGRLPDMRDMTNVVLFLASDESAYMTGVALDVNGGSWMA
jgi:NAD(P)-dependent dehydrogenase (short-subunit alcohol dehydrogenase family)